MSDGAPMEFIVTIDAAEARHIRRINETFISCWTKRDLEILDGFLDAFVTALDTRAAKLAQETPEPCQPAPSQLIHLHAHMKATAGAKPEPEPRGGKSGL